MPVGGTTFVGRVVTPSQAVADQSVIIASVS